MKFLIILALAVAVIADEVPIVRQVQDVNPDGSYNYAYETGNGIAAQEGGVGGVSVSGSASWQAPEGDKVEFSYVADENGYQPSGPWLPQAPEIPAAILRSLEWIAAHPPTDESAYKGN